MLTCLTYLYVIQGVSGAFALTDHHGVHVALSASSLKFEAPLAYTVIELNPATAARDGHNTYKAYSSLPSGVLTRQLQERSKSNVVLSDKAGRLLRVVVTCLGTGRYRGIAIKALESVREKYVFITY